MYGDYKDVVNFVLVYIREAHPTDGWRMPQNDQQGIKIKDPKTTDERMEVANTCIKELKLSLPCLVDNAENQANGLYCGWPDRIYVIDKGGKVTYQGALGPFGFKVQDARSAVKDLVGDPPSRDKEK